MPFTYLSHQAPVLALKRRWPDRVDGTAMVFGSMAPDWPYAVHGTRLAFDAHAGWGFVLFCAPAALVAAAVLRRVAPVLFAYVPSPSALPLDRLRTLSRRGPGLAVSAASAFVGALTHVAWDLFTHNGSWGPRHIAWLRADALTALGRTLSWAGVLQWTGHVVGAVVAAWLLSRLLTAADGTAEPRPAGGLVRFWAVTVVGVAAGGAWAAMGDPGYPGRIIRMSVGLGVGLVAASVACARYVLPAGTSSHRWSHHRQ